MQQVNASIEQGEYYREQILQQEPSNYDLSFFLNFIVHMK